MEFNHIISGSIEDVNPQIKNLHNPTKNKFLYLVYFKNRDLYKIGTSRRPFNRLRCYNLFDAYVSVSECPINDKELEPLFLNTLSSKCIKYDLYKNKREFFTTREPIDNLIRVMNNMVYEEIKDKLILGHFII